MMQQTPAPAESTAGRLSAVGAATNLARGTLNRRLLGVGGRAAPVRKSFRESYSQWKTFPAVLNGKEACQNP